MSGPNYSGINEIQALLLRGNLVMNLTSTKTSAYTVLNTDCIVPCDTTGGAFTVTLPLAADLKAGQFVVVKDVGGDIGNNNITIDTTSSETIDGNLTVILNSNYTSAWLYSNGSNQWHLT